MVKGKYISDLLNVLSPATELPGGLFEVEVLAGPVPGAYVNKKLTAEQLTEFLGLKSANSAKSLLKEFRFFRAVDRDADPAGGACFETDIDYATCCALTRARIEFYRENDGENFRQQDLECVYDSSPTPAGLAYVDGNFTGARNPSKFVKVAASSGGYTDEQINALLDAKLDTPIAASLSDIRQSIIDQEGALWAGVRYDIKGNWNATGTDSTVYVLALDLNTLSPNGILRTPDGATSAVSVDIRTRTTTPTASYAVQQQQAEQLARVAVRDSQVYGYLEAGGAPVGYGSLDASTADTRQKIFQTFNVAQLTLTTSNPTSGTGWAYSTNAQGNTLQLNADVVLSLPGSDVGTLTFTDFYVQGNRGSKLRLLTTAPASTAAALLPFLRGYCNTPLELANGGAVLLSGYYVSLTGTGTVYALEPFKADAVAAGVTVVKIGGGGAGTVKTVNGTAPDAAGNVALPTRDVNGYSQAKRQQVFQLFTSPTQFKAVDVPLNGDTSTGPNSVIPDLANGDLYTLLPDPDNRDSRGNATLTWLRTSFS